MLCEEMKQFAATLAPPGGWNEWILFAPPQWSQWPLLFYYLLHCHIMTEIQILKFRFQIVFVEMKPMIDSCDCPSGATSERWRLSEPAGTGDSSTYLLQKQNGR